MADTPNASGEPGELYLDAAATESVSPAVIEAMTPFLTEAYANPASVHQPGKTAARALDAARASFAAALGARPDDVIFTSGGTESDNLAIKGIAMARMRKLGLRPVCGFAEADGKQPANCRPRIIISAIEHPAVAQSAAWLHEWFGFEVVRIPVDAQAHLDLDALERELDGEASERTTMVSTMLANNEVGTVEPVEELVRIAHAHGVPIHVDAVQAAGQIPIRFRDWDVDALSVSGHKFGTPKVWERCWYAAAHPSNRCCPEAGRNAACALARRTWPVPWRSPSDSTNRMRACRRSTVSWSRPETCSSTRFAGSRLAPT